MALSDGDVDKALSTPDSSTKDFIFQQTMLRVKDPNVSLDFYSRVLGMRSVFKILCWSLYADHCTCVYTCCVSYFFLQTTIMLKIVAAL